MPSKFTHLGDRHAKSAMRKSTAWLIARKYRVSGGRVSQLNTKGINSEIFN